MKSRLVLFLFLLAGTLGRAAPGPELVTIIANVNLALNSLSKDEVARIFLITKTSLSDGSPIEPVLQKEGPAYQRFLKVYLGKTDSALTIYYRSLVFTGRGSMPKTLKSDAQVLEYVARSKSAIGFVRGAVNTPDVKIVEVR